MSQIIQARIIPASASASAWGSEVPAQGEFAVEIGSPMKLKLGDGVTPYSGLPYLGEGSGDYLGLAYNSASGASYYCSIWITIRCLFSYK